MTPREIIRRVLKFDDPPRIGLALPDPYGNDFVGCGFAPDGGFTDRRISPQGNEKWRREDIWGNIWASLTDFDKGEVVQGAITDWSQLDSYQPPDLADPSRYEKARQLFSSQPDKFRLGWIPGNVFNVARYIRKLENYLCDLILERDNVRRLHDIVRPQLLACVERMADAGADAVFFPEDWGTQDRLMIAPSMWREVFKPEFVTLCKAAHGRGMFVFMHSCGKITDIIPDLIESGVDLLQFDQPQLHGIDALARFAGQVSFWCPVDIQRTLQSKDDKKIAAEARELVEKLGGQSRRTGSRHGGFVAGYYGGNQAIGLSDDIQEHACMAFAEHAKYSQAQ